jgi:ferredoxin
MESARQILANLKVQMEHINQESFGSQAAPESSLPDSTVEFFRSGRSCAIQSGKTLLQVAEENGIPIPSACRQGQCGTCKSRLLAGHVIMGTEQGLPPHLKAEGFVLTCVGHANGPVKLDA